MESNASAINAMELRLSSIEHSLQHNTYEAELNKQNALSRNLNIMGVPVTDNENLTAITLKIFSLLGCELSRSDLTGCYRVNRSNSNRSIFIVKTSDFSIKQRILKAKMKKDLTLRDVLGTNSSLNSPTIFINNHVTPLFGKLLAAGRQAVKDKKIYSVWLSRNGCKFRLQANDG